MQKINTKKILIYSLLFFILACPVMVNADNLSSPSATLVNPLPYHNPTELVARILRIALGLLGAASLLMFLYAGLTWMTARGNSNQITKGKDTMIWAVVGLVVVFGSYAILNFIFDVFAF